MEDHDRRVIEARAALGEACQRDPSELTLDELKQEVARFRKYVRWLIDLADDTADTEYDEEVSQVMLYGGVYLSPADALKLCGGCMQLVDVVGKWRHEQTASRPPPISISSAA